MNQKDYKKIAEIIKARIVVFSGKVRLINKIDLIKELADYFEEDDRVYSGNVDVEFNRRQFLKDCGVDEKKGV